MFEQPCVSGKRGNLMPFMFLCDNHNMRMKVQY
jgi:hypothetical protein